MNPITTMRLPALWDLEDLPTCDKGTELARSFLEASGDAVSNLGQRADSSHFMSRRRTLPEHVSTCPNCLEL